ncbi:MAG: hypothetical protein U1E46_10335 [Hyphomicrobiales bacterium]
MGQIAGVGHIAGGMEGEGPAQLLFLFFSIGFLWAGEDRRLSTIQTGNDWARTVSEWSLYALFAGTLATSAVAVANSLGLTAALLLLKPIAVALLYFPISLSLWSNLVSGRK